MIEVVGGVAVVPLTLQLLGGCIKCYETFIAVAEMPSQYEHLRIRLSLEQARLLSWGEKMGLSEEDLTPPNSTLRSHCSTILETLSEVQRLFCSCLKMGHKIENTNAYRFSTQLNQITSRSLRSRLASRVDDLLRLMLATQISADPQIAELPDISVSRERTGIAELPDTSFARLVNFKAEQLTVDAASRVAFEAIEAYLVNIEEKDFGGRSLASYEGKEAWIEWKEHDMISTISQQMTETRIQKLAALLSTPNMPEEFRVPHCLGYTQGTGEDLTLYGLLHSIPSSIPEARPISLLDLLQERPKPSLSLRIALAYAISSSLLYLHSVNWLHKGIRSENIIFLIPPGKNPNYKSPIMSGFEYARPDLPEEQTEKPMTDFQHDIYRHPDALGRPDIRSKKSWDIYSLGIVLIKIAFWTSISRILDLSDNQRRARSRLRKVRSEVLAEEFLDRVGAEAGDCFRDIVKRCIEGGLSIGIPDSADEADPEIGAEMQTALSVYIFGALRGIHT